MAGLASPVGMDGPVANLCLEDHMRKLIENGFEVAMVRDAVAAASNEEGDGYQAAMINWRFMANAVWMTSETIERMAAAAVLQVDVDGVVTIGLRRPSRSWMPEHTALLDQAG